MKMLLLFLSIIFCWSLSYSQSRFNALANDTLHGKVASLISTTTTISTHRLGNGAIEEDIQDKQFYDYDEFGLLTGRVDSAYLRSSGIRHTYTYDDKQRLIQEILYWGNAQPWLKKVYTYQGGRMEFSQFFCPDSTSKPDRIVYKYNILHQKTVCYWYNKDGKMDSKSFYKYNKAGRQTFECGYVRGGKWGNKIKLYNKIWYLYDANGYQVKKTELIKGEAKENITTYVYSKIDKKGNWLQMDIYTNFWFPHTVISRQITYYP